VAQFWASQGTAGWRLDAADQKSHAWWQAFRASFKAAYPDDVLIGEATGGPIDALPWLMGNEMDGVMNYRFRDAILGFFASGRDSVSGRPISTTFFFDELMSVLEEYPEPALYSSMNLVDSHDTTRILTDLLGSTQALRDVATLQMTWKGAPTIYYGDEAGLEGLTDPDDRRTFPWGHEDTSLQDFYRKLISIRQSHPALRDGSVSPLVLDNAHRILGFLRVDLTERVAVLINDGHSARTVSVTIPNAPNGTRLVDALGGGRYTVKNGKLRVSVAALASRILVPANG
jgi:glycosidase